MKHQKWYHLQINIRSPPSREAWIEILTERFMALRAAAAFQMDGGGCFCASEALKSCLSQNDLTMQAFRGILYKKNLHWEVKL